jgi:hypothetical protein
MQLSNTIAGLQEDISNLAALADEAVAESLTRLAGAMAAPASMRLLDLLGEAALEVSAQLSAGRVELRVAGRDADLVYVDEPASQAEADLGDDQSARISLRLPSQLKADIERAAAQEGVSTNAWIVRALGRRASAGRAFQSQKRLTGYGWS